jgi:hypothetical protein
MLQTQFEALKEARKRALLLQGTDRGVIVAKRWRRDGTTGYAVLEFTIGEPESWRPLLAPRPRLAID